MIKAQIERLERSKNCVIDAIAQWGHSFSQDALQYNQDYAAFLEYKIMQLKKVLKSDDVFKAFAHLWDDAKIKDNIYQRRWNLIDIEKMNFCRFRGHKNNPQNALALSVTPWEAAAFGAPIYTESDPQTSTIEIQVRKKLPNPIEEAHNL